MSGGAQAAASYSNGHGAQSAYIEQPFGHPCTAAAAAASIIGNTRDSTTATTTHHLNPNLFNAWRHKPSENAGISVDLGSSERGLLAGRDDLPIRPAANVLHHPDGMNRTSAGIHPACDSLHQIASWP
ncbi:hypothetical protein D3C77_570330 [compost metagenome]